MFLLFRLLYFQEVIEKAQSEYLRQNPDAQSRDNKGGKKRKGK